MLQKVRFPVTETMAVTKLLSQFILQKMVGNHSWKDGSSQHGMAMYYCTTMCAHTHKNQDVPCPIINGDGTRQHLMILTSTSSMLEKPVSADQAPSNYPFSLSHSLASVLALHVQWEHPITSNITREAGKQVFTFSLAIDASYSIRQPCQQLPLWLNRGCP